MNVDKAVLDLCRILLSCSDSALGYWVNPYWYLLTAFAGLNMIQASFTGFCPAAIVFKKLWPAKRQCVLLEPDALRTVNETLTLPFKLRCRTNRIFRSFR